MNVSHIHQHWELETNSISNISNDNPSSELSQDVPKERPQRQRKEMASGLGDYYQGGGMHHRCIFGKTPKY
jgi:hypothetical protein